MAHSSEIPLTCCLFVPGLVEVRDESALARQVHALVVGPHLALDGEQQRLQVPLLARPC